MNDNYFVGTNCKFGYRHHRSTLKESLQTCVYIRKDSFENMLHSGIFTFYGYDSRCKQVLWLSTTQEWLFIELL